MRPAVYLLSGSYKRLVRAADRYRPQEYGGTPFSAYARSVIRRAIPDSVRLGNYVEATLPARQRRLIRLHYTVGLRLAPPALDRR